MRVVHRIWGKIKEWETRSDLLLLLLNPYFIEKKMLRDALKKEAAQLAGRQLVIDIGCGEQPYRKYFTQFRQYAGFDLIAPPRSGVISKAANLPLADSVADAVLCTEVIEHTQDPKKVCEEISRVLKKGGTLLLSAPMSWNLHLEPHDYYRFTRHGLVYLLERSGMSVIRVVRIGGIVSLIGARLADVLHRKLEQLPLGIRPPMRRRVASLAVSPVNSVFYILALIFDRIDETDAIGWLVVAQK